MKKILTKAIQFIFFEAIWIAIGFYACIKAGIYVIY